MFKVFADTFKFLSHLCGEEAMEKFLEGEGKFLSHLCGEEECLLMLVVL